MSDRRICPASGKVCYRGAKEARRAHQHASYRIRVYTCPECGLQHVTNDEKRRERPKERT